MMVILTQMIVIMTNCNECKNNNNIIMIMMMIIIIMIIKMIMIIMINSNYRFGKKMVLNPFSTGTGWTLYKVNGGFRILYGMG